MSSDNQEQTFSIQPHPATTNDPATDPALNPNQPNQFTTGGITGQGSVSGQAGPHIPDQDIAQGLEKPKSKEELKELTAQLNAPKDN